MSDAVTSADQLDASLVELSVSAGEAALIAQFPFLGLPVVKQIWEFLVDQLDAQVIANLQQTTTIGIIDFDDTEENTAAKAAAAQLEAVINAPSSTQEDIQKATTAFKTAYAALIAMRTATPIP